MRCLSVRPWSLSRSQSPRLSGHECVVFLPCPALLRCHRTDYIVCVYGSRRQDPKEPLRSHAATAGQAVQAGLQSDMQVKWLGGIGAVLKWHDTASAARQSSFCSSPECTNQVAVCGPKADFARHWAVRPKRILPPPLLPQRKGTPLQCTPTPRTCQDLEGLEGFISVALAYYAAWTVSPYIGRYTVCSTSWQCERQKRRNEAWRSGFSCAAAEGPRWKRSSLKYRSWRRASLPSNGSLLPGRQGLWAKYVRWCHSIKAVRIIFLCWWLQTGTSLSSSLGSP